MNTRNWPIRSKIIALVAAPIAALLALWIFATTLTLGPVTSLLQAQSLLDEVGRPGETLVAELQQERRVSMVHLAGSGDATALSAQRARTDDALAEFRRRITGSQYSDVGDGTFAVRLADTMAALDELPAGRGRIDRREMKSTDAFALYSDMLNRAMRAFTAMVVPVDDTALTREAQALVALSRAREVLEQSDALITGALAGGQVSEAEYSHLAQVIGTHRYLYTDAVADLPAEGQEAYRRMSESDAFVRLRTMEQDVIDKGQVGEPLPIDGRAWQSSFDTARQQLRDFNLDSSQSITERGRPIAFGIIGRLAVAGVLGFVAVLVSLIIGVRVGRSLVQRLTGLRTAAEQMATERLPAVVARLRRGEDVDVAGETPSLDYGADEIGQVGRAFIAVQQTAVRSAVDEAALRRGLNDVFLNIARRSQTLLHRQLALLDKMERRTTEPEELEDLFRVDHLATRMRRHAEDLVILAGAAPGRGWRNPVPMVDVVRGGISEVEEYSRVDIGGVQSAACVGRAVGDLVHLLAELIENATSFSPPHTRVRVSGQMVPNGYAIEVEDRGLGMTIEAIAEANRRLVEPPDFDPANSARLGLFVVAQLGSRHGIRVQLRPSPYGGVTAVVLIPADLIDHGGTGAIALPGRANGSVPARSSAGAELRRSTTLRRPSELLPPATGGETSVAASSTTETSTGAPTTGAGTDPPLRLEARPEDVIDPPDTPRRPGPDSETAQHVPTTAMFDRSAESDPAAVFGVTGPGAPGDAAAERTAAGVPGSDAARPTFAEAPTEVLPVVSVDPARRSAAAPAPAQPIPATEDGLPRRVRQSSLAPQLRATPPVRGSGAEPANRHRPASRAEPAGRAGGAGPGRPTSGPGRAQLASASTETGPPDVPPIRSPEQVRAVMAALQAGTARGRQDAGTSDDTPDAPPVSDRDSTEPGRDA